MADIKPWSFDILTRAIRLEWTEGEFQPLLAVYTGSPPVDKTPVATALDSGQTFDGVNAGASGLGYTVLTKGLVCFGTPRDGVACFLAAPDWKLDAFNTESITIKRGKVETDEDGSQHLRWHDVGGGPGLVALTFAGAAFHAVYCEDSGFGPTKIATSFDGRNWNEQPDAFPVGTFESPVSMGITGGAVAFSGEPETTEGIYAAAGKAVVDTPDEDPAWAEFRTVPNLAWSTATGPPPPDPDGDPPPITHLEWSYGSITNPRGNPGANTSDPQLINMQATIAGGNDVFVAAALERDVPVIDFAGKPRAIPVSTAAVAFSSTGSEWKNTVLDGVQKGMREVQAEGGHDKTGDSRTLAVLFVRNEIKEDSYFVCSTFNTYHDQAESETATIWGTVHKSYDGKKWNLIKSVGAKGDGKFNYCFGLSAIDADLDNTTIVHL